MNDKFFLVLNGPATAGKSTLVKLITKENNIFTCKYDAIKWSISNYVSQNQAYQDLIKKMLLNQAKIALDAGFSIIIDGGFGDYRERYQNLANKYKCKYLSVNLEPPFEVLEERFLKRVRSAQQSNSQIAVTTLEGLRRNYEWYLANNRDPGGLTIDSSKYTPDEIFKIVKEKLVNF